MKPPLVSKAALDEAVKSIVKSTLAGVGVLELLLQPPRQEPTKIAAEPNPQLKKKILFFPCLFF